MNHLLIGNHFILYNTVALDRMRICTSSNIFDTLGLIENTCVVQKQTAVRTTKEILCVEHPKKKTCCKS